MIKTKFWFFCVLMVLLLGVNLIHTARQHDADAKSAAESRLIWAESRYAELQAGELQGPLQAVVEAAALAEVRALLTAAATAEGALDAEGFEGVIQRLGEAASRGGLHHGLIVVATPHGASRLVVGQAAEHDIETPDVLVLRSALDGTARAGLTTLDDALVRVAAAPIASGDDVLGALLLGFPVDAASVGRHREALGLDVTLVVDGSVAASSLPANGREPLVAAARRGAPGRTYGYGEPDGMVLGLTAPITGVEPVLGYARSLPLAGVDQGTAVLSVSTADGFAWLEEYQTLHAIVVGALLLIGLIWGFFIAQSAGGPVKDITAQLARAASGDLNTRLQAQKYRGPFRRFAEVINGVLDQVEHKTPVAPKGLGNKSEDLSSLLPDSPPPPEEATADAFDFGGIGAAPSDPPAPPPPAPEPPPAAEPEPAVAAFDAPPVPEEDPASFDPFSADAPVAPPPAPEPEPAFAPPADEDYSDDSTRVVSLDAMQAAAAASESAGGGADPLGAPTSAQAATASSLAGASDDPFAAAYSEPSDFDDDVNPDATVVAKVPTALLQATARAGGGAAATPADPDEAHFREVFRDFVATRQKCGEPADGVTFDKFAAKLRKNRDTIKGKHGARGVRFQVYVKEGKAALKATPIK
jgi:hypothetical protein